MSQVEKLINRLLSKPKDFTYDELKQILNYFGFYEYNKGKTSGSRVSFVNHDNIKFELHKPHPTNVLKPYVVNKLIEFVYRRR